MDRSAGSLWHDRPVGRLAGVKEPSAQVSSGVALDLAMGGASIDRALARIPEGQPLALRTHVLNDLDSLCSTVTPPYDWNPNRLMAVADSTSVLHRSGRLLLLRLVSRQGSATPINLMWGRGDPAPFRPIVSDNPLVRCDRDTWRRLQVRFPRSPTRESRDLAEYVYDLADQVALVGRRYARRRTYLRAANDTWVARLDLHHRPTVDDVMTLSEAWYEQRRPLSQTMVLEQAALATSLGGASRFGHSLKGVGVFNDSRMVGFAIYDVHGSRAFAHFVKAAPVSAIFARLWHALFEQALKDGAGSLNGGYDGGLTNLRRAKLNLVPHDILCPVYLTLDGRA